MKEIDANLIITPGELYDGPERRAYRRIKVRLLVPAKIKGSRSGFEFTHTLNLSVGGVLLQSPEQIDIGALIVTILQLNGPDKPPIELLGRVIRLDSKDNGSFLYGICFQEISDNDRNTIEAFVSANSE